MLSLTVYKKLNPHFTLPVDSVWNQHYWKMLLDFSTSFVNVVFVTVVWICECTVLE